MELLFPAFISEVEVDNTLENALSFIESCRSGLEDRYQCRGPFLAQLELIKQCQHAGIKWTEYGEKFGSYGGVQCTRTKYGLNLDIKLFSRTSGQNMLEKYSETFNHDASVCS
ncbi:hypothetical protein DPMN_015115 [Dreissena polymorpha]|uniref:Uncharacterized protein n=1 Tax=Dreissena polymorpha TaxID=45954 RepID=A0A9D4NC27_DREPO|nr:hypothetical protein DPMN_015115 [Dreissena polymorpha]